MDYSQNWQDEVQCYLLLPTDLQKYVLSFAPEYYIQDYIDIIKDNITDKSFQYESLFSQCYLMKFYTHIHLVTFVCLIICYRNHKHLIFQKRCQ